MPTIVKMDKRYTGHLYFDYFLKISNPEDKFLNFNFNFHNIRAWCWETWGPSKGLHDWIRFEIESKSRYKLYPENIDRCQNPHWCWLDESSGQQSWFGTDPSYLRKRIMFASANEVALYKLTYGI